MRYIIDAPSNLYKIDGTLIVPVKVGEGDLYWYNTYLKAESYTEPDRKDIEDEVWEFLDFLFTGMNAEERYKCFDEVFSHTIVSIMSYQEAKAKYEAWLKQKDEIHVGDEVEYLPNKAKGIVVQCHVPDVYAEVDKYAVFTGTSVEYLPIEWLTKTGRVFPEVAELLEKTRGEEE